MYFQREQDRSALNCKDYPVMNGRTFSWNG